MVVKQLGSRRHLFDCVLSLISIIKSYYFPEYIYRMLIKIPMKKNIREKSLKYWHRQSYMGFFFFSFLDFLKDLAVNFAKSIL